MEGKPKFIYLGKRKASGFFLSLDFDKSICICRQGVNTPEVLKVKLLIETGATDLAKVDPYVLASLLLMWLDEYPFFFF